MRLYYFKDREGNFGDDLNPWLWQQLFPDFFNEADEDLFLGVGTLLNHRIPAAPAVTVFGSGHGYGELPKVNANWRFYCVRGPLTAKALGLEENLAITDPTSLTPLFCTSNITKQFKVSFMPHCDSARFGDWKKVCQLAGIHFLDPRKPFLEVFDGIRQSELLLSEAMHGAILADSFRVPWIPVKAYPHISEYKWRDWLMSVQVEADFSTVAPIWRGDQATDKTVRLKNLVKRSLLNTPLWRSDWGKPPEPALTAQQLDAVAQSLTDIAKMAPPQLSLTKVFNENTARLQDKVQQFKLDFGI